MNFKKEFEYKIVEHVGTLSTSGAYSKEINILMIDGKEKLDIRNWQEMPSGERVMRKGICLSHEEGLLLCKYLQGLYKYALAEEDKAPEEVEEGQNDGAGGLENA